MNVKQNWEVIRYLHRRRKFYGRVVMYKSHQRKQYCAMVIQHQWRSFL